MIKSFSTLLSSADTLQCTCRTSGSLVLRFQSHQSGKLLHDPNVPSPRIKRLWAAGIPRASMVSYAQEDYLYCRGLSGVCSSQTHCRRCLGRHLLHYLSPFASIDRNWEPQWIRDSSRSPCTIQIEEGSRYKVLNWACSIFYCRHAGRDLRAC